MEKNIAEILRQSLEDSHGTLEGTMNGVTDEVAHFQPGGKALPIAAAYIHAVVSEDVLLNSWARKQKPLLEEWSPKMGVSAPHPQMDEHWEKNFAEWAKSVKIDVPKFQEYAKAVYKASNDYIAGLNDKDLIDVKVDLSAWQMGEWPIAKFIVEMLIGHINSLAGEISAVKGLQGLKGYPF